MLNETRFSGRVADYVKARPSYPRGALDVLARTCAVGPGVHVADLGSGTGLFTRLLLESGATVHAVEPNDEMRAAAESILGGEERFRSMAGGAEATTLADASVDVVTAAQAFHWFDVDAAREEMTRICRPRDGTHANVALVWNDRELEATPFSRAYEDLLVRRCPKYHELQGKADDTAAFDALLGASAWTRHVVPNEQRLDREGLVGRLMSSSYAPRRGEGGHDDTMSELREIFDRHSEGGAVVMLYTTVIIVGRVATK